MPDETRFGRRRGVQACFSVAKESNIHPCAGYEEKGASDTREGLQQPPRQHDPEQNREREHASRASIRTSPDPSLSLPLACTPYKCLRRLQSNDNTSYPAICSLMGASWLKATHKESAASSSRE